MGGVLRADVKAGYACNNNCLFCVVADKRGRDLSTEEVKRQISQAWDGGARDVVLTGGEITIRKDVCELAAFAKKCGFQGIQIQTNGRMLSDFDFTQKLCRAGATEFAPALHGSTDKMHDFLTQCTGAFNQTVKGIKNAKALGATVITNTVITKPNYRHAPEIAILLMDLEVDQFQLAFVHPLGNAFSNFDTIVPPISLAGGFVKKALGIGKRRNARMMAEAFPPCVLRGYEKYCSERYIPRTEIRAPESYIPDFDASRKNDGKAKGPRCRKCAFFKECEGPWKEYPQKRGWDEFVPVAQANG